MEIARIAIPDDRFSLIVAIGTPASSIVLFSRLPRQPNAHHHIIFERLLMSGAKKIQEALEAALGASSAM